MQWEYCAMCLWSVPMGTRLCEVCAALLANPAQRCMAEARVIVGQLWRALGEHALRSRYQAARAARRQAGTTAWWEDFVRRNGAGGCTSAPLGS